MPVPLGYKRSTPRRRQPMADRLLRHCTPEPNSGCWLWLGATVQSRGGALYGVIGGKVPRRREFAHRAAWEEWREPIPPGHKVCHRCDNSLCINPDHLFVGTQRDNIRDMHAKGRANMSGLALGRNKGASP